MDIGKILAAILVIMILTTSIAGCSYLLSSPQIKLPNEEEIRELTKKYKITEEIWKLAEEYKIEDILGEVLEVRDIELIQFIVEALTEEPYVKEEYRVVADNLSEMIKEFGPIDLSYFEDYEVFKRESYRINHIIEVINNKYGMELPKVPITKEFFDDFKYLRKGMEYLPVVTSYNELYNSSLKLPSLNDRDYQKFYINLALLGADIAFTEYKLGYKFAFKSTGEIIQALKLYKFRSIVGNKVYGLILSEIHWSVRGVFNETLDDLKELLRENDVF